MRIFLRWNRKFVAHLRDWIVNQWSWRAAFYAVLLVFVLNERGLCSAQLLNGTQQTNATRTTPTQPLSFLPSTSAPSCRMRQNRSSSRHLRSASVPALCSCLNRVEHSEARCILEDYRLGFCSKIPLDLLTETDFDNITVCHLRLEKLLHADDRANRDFLQFQDIVNRGDCASVAGPENRFSVRWKCADCLDAYKNWICAGIVLPEVSNMASCASICVRVLQRCPYYVPNVEYQYSGMPVFDCNEKVLESFEDGEKKSCFKFTAERKATANCSKFDTNLATTSQPQSSLEVDPESTSSVTVTVVSAFTEQSSKNNVSLANTYSNQTSDRRDDNSDS